MIKRETLKRLWTKEGDSVYWCQVPQKVHWWLIWNSQWTMSWRDLIQTEKSRKKSQRRARGQRRAGGGQRTGMGGGQTETMCNGRICCLMQYCARADQPCTAFGWTRIVMGGAVA